MRLIDNKEKRKAPCGLLQQSTKCILFRCEHLSLTVYIMPHLKKDCKKFLIRCLGGIVYVNYQQ